MKKDGQKSPSLFLLKIKYKGIGGTPKIVFVCTYKIRKDFRTDKDLTGYFFQEISKCAVVILNCNTAICNQDKEKM